MSYKIKICPVCFKQENVLCQHLDGDLETYVEPVEVEVKPVGSLDELPVVKRVYRGDELIEGVPTSPRPGVPR